MRPESKIRAFIADNFVLAEEGADLPSDASLLDLGVLDSTAVIELVTFLEEAFEVEIADSELVPENLDSIDAICAFIDRKTGPGRAP